jgi:hypothetical protein
VLSWLASKAEPDWAEAGDAETMEKLASATATHTIQIFAQLPPRWYVGGTR